MPALLRRPVTNHPERTTGTEVWMPEVWRQAVDDEQLLAEDEEFEVAIGGCAAAEYEEVDQQAKESIDEGQQHERAE